MVPLLRTAASRGQASRGQGQASRGAAQERRQSAVDRVAGLVNTLARTARGRPEIEPLVMTAVICPNAIAAFQSSDALQEGLLFDQTLRNVKVVPARTGLGRALPPVTSCRLHGLVLHCLPRSATLQARLESNHQGWILPCESSSPEEPVTSAQRSSPCSSNRGIASGFSIASSSAATACFLAARTGSSSFRRATSATPRP